MILIGTVERVGPGRFVLRERRNGRRVVVFTRQTRCIFPGDLVSVLYNGVMTRSFPPQVTAIAVRRLSPQRNCR